MASPDTVEKQSPNSDDRLISRLANHTVLVQLNHIKPQVSVIESRVNGHWQRDSPTEEHHHGTHGLGTQEPIKLPSKGRPTSAN